ncbi:hypothetical protein BC962_3132 [Gillisia mitskevichiae]|uniref:Outer membrane protein with beta-barrel domain n=1 Tax=Gillisia mitskevichiae TaxID=270921 RepID=A0A495NY36_9FLAO|nr:DUF6048 family protein [Gillisia mitskevichiae]RKS42675.1 hypothetical protein BC962_3132 [Gillisia mitskevichiae]
MKQQHIFLFFISIFCLLGIESSNAQTATDTVNYKERYGLRVGVDLSKPIRTLLQDDYSGLELLGDYRIYKNYYLAAELGNEQIDLPEENLSVSSKGSYIKLGADYNAYENWAGMENAIIIGLRYGFSTFSQTLESYAISTQTPYFGSDLRVDPEESTGLTASWAELVVGVKVELFQNLYLGANVQLKRRISESTPSNMDNLYIPGFGATNDFSDFGVGYSYNISYLIPLYKKAKK